MQVLKNFRLLRHRFAIPRNDIITVGIFCTFFFILSSCSQTHKPNTLRFSQFWTEPGQRTVLDSVINDFKKENPGIDVEIIDLSWADGKTKLMINFNSQTAPDVIELGSDWVAQFSSSNVLEENCA